MSTKEEIVEYLRALVGSKIPGGARKLTSGTSFGVDRLKQEGLIEAIQSGAATQTKLELPEGHITLGELADMVIKAGGKPPGPKAIPEKPREL